MAPLAPFTLAAALQSMGVAEIFLGNPLITPGGAGGMVSLGATEGVITFAAPQTLNVLNAPELTGEVAHQATVTLGAVTITAPVIMGDPALWARISATGRAAGGVSRPVAIAETSVLLIPRSEVGGGLVYSGSWARTAGNGVAAAAAAAAAPKNAVWLWRAGVSMGDVPFGYANGGKVIVTVTFTGMFDATKPEGHKVFTIGDPYTATNADTGVAAPIPVLPSGA